MPWMRCWAAWPVWGVWAWHTSPTGTSRVPERPFRSCCPASGALSASSPAASSSCLEEKALHFRRYILGYLTFPLSSLNYLFPLSYSLMVPFSWESNTPATTLSVIPLGLWFPPSFGCQVTFCFESSWLLLSLFFEHSYAEKAQSPALCRAAARHYWDSCLPLTQAPADRQQLQGPLERILSALCHTGAQHTKVLILHRSDKGHLYSITTSVLWCVWSWKSISSTEP